MSGSGGGAPLSGVPGSFRGCLALPGEKPPGAAAHASRPRWHRRGCKLTPSPGHRALGGRRGKEQPWVRELRPHHKASPGHGCSGRLARSSPRKWLTQRLRSALGMLQMVTHRCLTDRGCPDGSPEPASSLSYLTPFSRMFATCKGSPHKAPQQSTESRPSRPRCHGTKRRLRNAQGLQGPAFPGGGSRGPHPAPNDRADGRSVAAPGRWRSGEQNPVSGAPTPWPQDETSVRERE